jgi:muramidase (phage lysozyme)
MTLAELTILSIIAFHTSTTQDFNTAVRIARCESSLNPLAQNQKSTAGGLFQIIKSTQVEVEKATNQKYDVFNPADNTKMAIWLMKKYGTRPWNSSKKCWGK